MTLVTLVTIVLHLGPKKISGFHGGAPLWQDLETEQVHRCNQIWSIWWLWTANRAGSAADDVWWRGTPPKCRILFTSDLQLVALCFLFILRPAVAADRHSANSMATFPSQSALGGIITEEIRPQRSTLPTNLCSDDGPGIFSNREGWLQKEDPRGLIYKQWKRRYFRLTNDVLEYSKSQNDPALRQVNLLNIKAIARAENKRRGEGVFEVATNLFQVNLCVCLLLLHLSWCNPCAFLRHVCSSCCVYIGSALFVHLGGITDVINRQMAVVKTQ